MKIENGDLVHRDIDGDRLVFEMNDPDQLVLINGSVYINRQESLELAGYLQRFGLTGELKEGGDDDNKPDTDPLIPVVLATPDQQLAREKLAFWERALLAFGQPHYDTMQEAVESANIATEEWLKARERFGVQ